MAAAGHPSVPSNSCDSVTMAAAAAGDPLAGEPEAPTLLPGI